jgi:sterol desaturase/sphingolipid hydroxylase (fatty acid hydroxylase superfamily)
MDELWRGFVAGLPSTETYLQLLIVVGGFLLAERLFPAERAQPVRARFLTAEFTFLYFLLTPTVMLLPIALAGAIAKATGGALFNLNLNALATGHETLDWVLRNILFPFVPFIVFDFFYYWHHRLQHTIPAFWEQHKLHHTDEAVYCLSSGRHHWLEEGIRVFTCSIPMAFLLTLGAVQGVAMVIVLAQWAIFIHANVRLPLGPLTPVLTGPQLHRIHHSREPQHANKNFAAFVPLWDIVFGTYYRPQANEWPSTGLASRETVNSLWAAAFMPFYAWGRALLAPLRRGNPRPGQTIDIGERRVP